MTVTTALALDLVILVVLAYCVIMGVRRGFVLTLCSLLAVVVALAGGWYLSNHYSEPLQEKLEPMIAEKLLSSAQEKAEEEGLTLPEDGGSSGNAFLDHFSHSIQEQVTQQAESFRDATIHELAASLASLLARSVLFLVGFVVVLLVWKVLSHVLNLVAKLPVLRTLNRFLGGIAGFLKGILILALARWILFDLLGLVSVQAAEASYLLPLLEKLPIFSPF